MASSSIPANPTSNNVAHLLPKLSDPDSDLRYMALNDLRQIFNTAHQTFLLHDYNTCARTVDGFCHTLIDTNGEVQNMTIQCLGPFVNRVPDTILCPLIDKVSNLQTDNTVDSSIPALALRAIVVALPRPVSGVARTKAVNDSYVAISRALIPRLVGYNVFPPKEKNLPAVPKGMLVDDMEKGTDSNAIDVLTEVARCFGPMLKDPEIQALQRTTLEVLESERSGSVLKKKAVAAVSTLANYFSDALLSGFISRIIEKLRDEHLSKSKQKLYITIIGSMARANPRKVGPYLQTLTPFILNPLETDADEGMEEDEERDPEIDEVQEAALVAIEGFLAACSRDMRMFTDEVINAAVKLLKYDPNNFMHDDEDMAEEEEDEELEGDDFEEEGGYDDDDDSSWKVRRCAAKVLYTLIMTRGKGELLDDGTLYSRVAPALVSRFKEREETVRLEVLATLIALVRLTSDRTDVPELSTSDDATRGIMLPPPSRKRRRGGSDASMLDGQTNASLKSGSALPEASAPSSGARLELTKISPEIVKGVAQLLKTGPLPTKQTSIVLLKNLVITQHGGLTDYLGQTIGPVVDAAKSSGSAGLSSASSAATGNTLRINALQLLGALAHSHSAGVLQPHLEKIVPTLVKGAQDKYSKVSVESLSAIEQYILAMTPPRSTTASFQAQLASLFDVLVSRISATDADLEVRQQAIHVLGLLLGRSSAVPGLLSAGKRKVGLDLLQDRLKNELTRLATVRAIDVIGSLSKDKQDLQSPWVREVAVELSLQFRKASRTLRGASLSALRSLAVNPSTRAHIDDKTTKALLEHLLPTLTSNDLHMLGPGLTILAAFVQDNPKAVMTSDVVKALCFVVQSSVTGSSMEALLMLMRVIGQQGVGAELMQAFLKDVGVSGNTDIVGKVIGTLLVAGSSSLPVKLDDFIKELNTAQDDKRKCLALSVLGEASLRLGSSSPLTPDVFMSHFQSKSDQVPLAAANALGRAGAGNVQAYLPAILDMMSKPNSRKYLLLHAVKEILKQPGAEADIIPHANSLWQNVLAAAQADDNRAIGAECIGRLAIIDPKTYLPQLKVILHVVERSQAPRN